jgi:hypothetical protein
MPTSKAASTRRKGRPGGGARGRGSTRASPNAMSGPGSRLTTASKTTQRVARGWRASSGSRKGRARRRRQGATQIKEAAPKGSGQAESDAKGNGQCTMHSAANEEIVQPPHGRRASVERAQAAGKSEHCGGANGQRKSKRRRRRAAATQKARPQAAANAQCTVQQTTKLSSHLLGGARRPSMLRRTES